MQPHVTFQFGILSGKEEVMTSGEGEPSLGLPQQGPRRYGDGHQGAAFRQWGQRHRLECIKPFASRLSHGQNQCPGEVSNYEERLKDHRAPTTLRGLQSAFSHTRFTLRPAEWGRRGLPPHWIRQWLKSVIAQPCPIL